MPGLTGVRAKLRRADEHRQAYDDLFARFLETQPYSILFEFDPESGWHVFRWLVTSEPPLSARSRPGVRAGPAFASREARSDSAVGVRLGLGRRQAPVARLPERRCVHDVRRLGRRAVLLFRLRPSHVTTGDVLGVVGAELEIPQTVCVCAHPSPLSLDGDRLCDPVVPV